VRSAQVSPDILVFLLCVEHLMHAGNGNRALTNRRRHPLDIAVPDVADREHAG
jgi:hypothetical protein